jgi:hypothetical protein
MDAFKVYDTHFSTNLVPDNDDSVVFDSIKMYYTLPLLNVSTGSRIVTINIPVQQTTVA